MINYLIHMYILFSYNINKRLEFCNVNYNIIKFMLITILMIITVQAKLIMIMKKHNLFYAFTTYINRVNIVSKCRETYLFIPQRSSRNPEPYAQTFEDPTQMCLERNSVHYKCLFCPDDSAADSDLVFRKRNIEFQCFTTL